MNDRQQLPEKLGQAKQPQVYRGDYKAMKTDKQTPLTVLFLNFLKGTTAHGLPKVVTSESWTRKLMWLSVFCITFGYFTFQCTILVEAYFKYPVAVRINIDTSQRLKFPAVTICNMNMLRKGVARSDPKYKELVGIDKFAEYTLNSLLKNRSASRKRRDLSENEDNKNIESGEEWSESLIASKMDGVAGERTSWDKGDYTRYLNRLGQAIVKGAEPHLKQTMLEVVKRWQQKAVMEQALAEETNTSSQSSTEGRRSEGEENKEGRLSDDKLRDDELLEVQKTATRGSRLKRQAYYDYGSGEDQYYYGEDYYYGYDYDDDGDDYEVFQYQDYGFAGRVQSDYAFKQFMNASKTNDYSDLIDVLKPSKEDLDAYGHQAADFILQCSFNKMNCSYLDFRKVYNPTYGLCYVFNDGFRNSTVRVTNKFGSRYGLRLTLDIEYDQYLGLFSHKAGARVAIHPSDITAFPEDFGISAAPGEETEIGISLETITRQPAPYPSNCTDGSHYKLFYEGNYTISACSQTCLQARLQKVCGCVDRLVVNRSIARCSVINQTQEACRQLIRHLQDIEKLGCDCPPSCQEHVYKSYTSSSEWPSIPYKYLLAGALVNTNSRLSSEGDILDRIKTTMLAIHVYLENPILVTIEEYPSYTWDRLLADIGGLLGLFIGISACTAIEFIEFLTDAAICVGRRIIGKDQVRIEPTVVVATSHGCQSTKSVVQTCHH